jgi:hypothetical protein
MHLMILLKSYILKYLKLKKIQFLKNIKLLLIFLKQTQHQTINCDDNITKINIHYYRFY